MEGREGLWLSAEQHGGVMVVTIRGDLDIVTSGRFDDCLKQARAVSKRIILDLAGVDFMDTSALAVVVGHWKKLKAEGGTLDPGRGALPVHEEPVDHGAGRPAAALRLGRAGHSGRRGGRRGRPGGWRPRW